MIGDVPSDVMASKPTAGGDAERARLASIEAQMLDLVAYADDLDEIVFPYEHDLSVRARGTVRASPELADSDRGLG